jgi:hypothetical protein
MFAIPAPGFFVPRRGPPRDFTFAALAASHNQAGGKILVNVLRPVLDSRSLTNWAK